MAIMGRAVAVRFAFAYLVLYIFPWPLGLIPGTGGLAGMIAGPIDALVPWVGDAVLGVGPVAQHPTGSGDTLFAFVYLVVVAALAVLVAGAWCVLERKRRVHAVLVDGVRVYLRFFLAAMMLSYGLIKIWKSQFPLPSEIRLAQPYGASTPMALLWTFMGASPAYTIFAGLSETAGGVLLFFRRTTTLGALVVSAVMTNVVLLNFCYDVPVKLFSLHLLVIALVLAAPDLPRLARLLFADASPSRSRRIARARTAIGLVAAGLLVYTFVDDASSRYPVNGDGRPPAEEYRVERMHPPRWKQVSLGTSMFSVLTSEDVAERWSVTRDPRAGTVTLGEVFRDPADHLLFVSAPEPGRLVLAGVVRGELITASLRRFEPAASRLLRNEFRWIQEYPDNR
jgi:hypothetical protein